MSRMLRAGSRASMRMASQRKLGVQVWCRCLWEYAAEYEDDLRIEPGDIIQVTDAEYDEGWWEGLNMRTGAQGIFPINHVEPCDGPGQQPAMEQGQGGRGNRGNAGGGIVSAAVSNPMGGGGGSIPGPPPKGASGMIGGGGGVPGPPPKGAKGVSSGGGGRSKGDKGGGRGGKAPQG